MDAKSAIEFVAVSVLKLFMNITPIAKSEEWTKWSDKERDQFVDNLRELGNWFGDTRALVDQPIWDKKVTVSVDPIRAKSSRNSDKAAEPEAGSREAFEKQFGRKLTDAEWVAAGGTLPETVEAPVS